MTVHDEPLQWTDGDQPFSVRFGDHFYSRENGRAETAHVFMGENQLPARWTALDGDFVIAELGFGTGLNFCETWRQWQLVRQRGQRLSFVSFEAFPMGADAIVRALSRWPDLAPCSQGLLRHWPPVSSAPQRWAMDGQTELTVIVGDALANAHAWKGMADAWYLDGFAPARNRDMWSAPLMQAVFDHTVPGGTFATYTAAGWVRRNLQAAGFVVKKRPGHGGKREMMHGHKPIA